MQEQVRGVHGWSSRDALIRSLEKQGGIGSAHPKSKVLSPTDVIAGWPSGRSGPQFLVMLSIYVDRPIGRLLL